MPHMPGRRMAVIGCFLAVALALAPSSAHAQGIVAGEPAAAELCPVSDAAALAYRVPPAFLARVLWRESRFHSHVTSPAGALGVAQFMPGTALERGLDPQDPVAAIREAARMLASLNAKFGNFGLAAAAYNAGSGRVTDWRQARSALPAETRRYVLAVTGRPVEDWSFGASSALPVDDRPCLQLLAEVKATPPERLALPGLASALARAFTAARPVLRPAVATRPAPPAALASVGPAENLCESIRELGADCRVYGR